MQPGPAKTPSHHQIAIYLFVPISPSYGSLRNYRLIVFAALLQRFVYLSANYFKLETPEWILMH